MSFMAGEYDIAVIGAGHAGIEAALAAARLGARVIQFATQLDAVGNMPCNPSIGGTAKGHLVREIDALGGEMGRAADAQCIQYRMLNRGKGPAVQSLRAQADRMGYRAHVKRVLENQENITLKQAEVMDILLENGQARAVVTATGAVYHVRAAVVAAGTFLRGRVITGQSIREGGPDGLHAATGLSGALERLGLSLRRFKTGTPPRALGRTMDKTRMALQPGEDTIPFSFASAAPVCNKAVCWQTWTTPETHEILRRNLSRSPLYSGVIEGVGARYCPSIEDKVVRFADKTRHPVFCEPMGLGTDEYYLQGLSSSMPEEIQLAVLHTIPGLENAEMTRPGYAIEYDCLDPLALDASLAVKAVPGLYGAGQICGTSGYEEAAALGLIAGINAARFVQGKPPFALARSTSYIGTLIDDLVTRGADEPYRMMTSRSEYRLLLRQDNADRRLTPRGYRVGLISEGRHRAMVDKYERIDRETARLQALVLPPSDALGAILEAQGSSLPKSGVRMGELLRRPELTWDVLKPLDPDAPELSPEERAGVEIGIKYEGYLRRQQAEADALARMENRRLPREIDYERVGGLRIEARQKLRAVRPENLGQAGRIPGVSPADLTALMIYLDRGKERARREHTCL